MPLLVLCLDCRSSFDAVLHAGLVRCATCADRHVPAFAPSPGRVIVMD